MSHIKLKRQNLYLHIYEIKRLCFEYFPVYMTSKGVNMWLLHSSGAGALKSTLKNFKISSVQILSLLFCKCLYTPVGAQPRSEHPLSLHILKTI